jgi:hypothetical protein
LSNRVQEIVHCIIDERHSIFCWRLFFFSSHALRDIIVSFYFCSFQKLKTIVGMGFFGSRRIIEITEVQSVAMLGFHKLCCHVGISQIMLPCFGVHKFCFQWQKEMVRMYLSKTLELVLIGALSSCCLDLSCDCYSMPLYVNFNTHHDTCIQSGIHKKAF